MRSTESNFFIGKPGFIRWFFLWDILLLQISFEVQKFLYLSYSWTCKCFRHWKCLCSKFWAFFASLPQHCRSNAFFYIFPRSCRWLYDHKFRWFCFIKFIFKNIKVPPQVRHAKCQSDKKNKFLNSTIVLPHNNWNFSKPKL